MKRFSLEDLNILEAILAVLLIMSGFLALMLIILLGIGAGISAAKESSGSAIVIVSSIYLFAIVWTFSNGRLFVTGICLIFIISFWIAVGYVYDDCTPPASEISLPHIFWE